MSTVAEIQQAFDIANEAGLTQEELDELDNQLIFIQDQKGAILFAQEEGLKRGLKRGLEQGLEQGLNMQRSIIRKLLETLDDQSVSQITGLSLDEVRSLGSQ